MNTRKDIRLPVALATLSVVLVLGAVFAFSRGLFQTSNMETQTEQTVQPDADPLRTEFDNAVQLLRTSHLELAATAFEKLIQKAPHMPEAHVNLGYSFIGMRRYTDARKQFEQALDMNPQQLNAYYGLALSHEGEGDLEKALGAMKTFVHLSDENDPFVRKARSAIWEWESAQESDKG